MSPIKVPKPNYLTPRGDNFYYIEIYNMRENNLNILLGGESIPELYLAGSQTRLEKVDRIECCIFWKHLESAKSRFNTLNHKDQLNGITLVLKIKTREEFIDIISSAEEKVLSSGREIYHWDILRRNVTLKNEELAYLEKLKKQNEIH